MTSKKSFILGLDISTSITGYSLYNDEDLKFGYWKMTNKKHFPNFFYKAQYISEGLQDLFKQYNISHVFIESPLTKFRYKKSSANTISTLIRFNGIISWIIYEKFGKTPNYLMPITARKRCGITVPKGKNAKEIVIKFLLDNEPRFYVEYTKFGNIKQHFYDIADAIVMAKAGANVKKIKTT